MARRKSRHTRKLSPAQVRAIFTSRDSAVEVAKKFKVSQNLVYLIWSRRVHAAITKAIRKPRRTRTVKRMSGQVRSSIDIDKLADAIVKRLIARLRRG